MKPKDSKFNGYIEQLVKLSENPKAKILGYNKEEFLELIDLLFGPILDNDKKTVFIEDARYITYAIQKLAEIEKLDLYLNAQNVPQEIIQSAEELGNTQKDKQVRLVAKDKVNQFIQRQEQLKTANIAQAQEDISQKAQAVVKASLPGSLARDAEVVEKLSEVVKREFLSAYLETILPKDLSPQVLQKVTQHIIETADLPEQLVAAESSLPPNVAQLIKANLRNLTWSPETTATIKEINKTGFVLPRPLREKMPSAGGPPSILGAIRSPHLFLQKAALFPITKATEVVAKASLDNEAALLQEIKNLRADPRANPQKIVALEWQLYVSSRFRTNNKFFSSLTGLTKADLEQFRIHLTVTRGLGPTDLGVQYIDNQIEKMAMFGQRSRLAGLFQRSLQFNREAGLVQPRLQVGQREFFLPRTKPLSSFGQKTIGFGEKIGYYRQFVEYPGIKVIRSVPLQKFADFRSFIFRKTLRPIFARLGQTAIGQGIKSGIRGIISKGATQSLIKIGTAIFTKLGIKGITTTLGTAIGGPVGAAIGAIAGFVIEPILKFAKDLLSKFKQLFTKPEFALGIGAIGGIFVIGGLGTVGVPLLALSGIGLATSAGGILGSAAAATVAALSLFFAPLAVPIAAFVISLVIGLMVITLFIVFLTASAFIIPAAPTERISEYFEVIKSADQGKIENSELAITINYMVTVNAKQAMTITSAYDERNVTCQPGSNPQFERRINLPLNSKGTNSWEAEYSLDIDDSFEDCRLCNTATVIANIGGGDTGIMNYDTLCIDIGEPPEDCPSGWPTDRGYITQGPKANWSHNDPYPQKAIDIGVVVGTPVKATHGGKVEETGGTGLNKWVKVSGSCGGQNFTTLYLHLETIDRDIQEGKPVSMDQPIGTSGEYKTEQHLHYEFVGLEMAWPNIGYSNDEWIDAILEGCCGGVPPCSSICSSHNVTW